MLEALYFVCAVAFVTVFGMMIVEGSGADLGFLAATSLPLVAAGALALWALALMVILRYTSIEGYTDRFGAKYRASIVGVVIVVALHFALGGAFFVSDKLLLGTIVSALGVLLGASAHGQQRWMSTALSSRQAIVRNSRVTSLA